MLTALIFQVQAGGREFEPHHECYMPLLAQMARALEVVIYVTQTAIFYSAGNGEVVGSNPTEGLK